MAAMWFTMKSNIGVRHNYAKVDKQYNVYLLYKNIIYSNYLLYKKYQYSNESWVPYMCIDFMYVHQQICGHCYINSELQKTQ